MKIVTTQSSIVVIGNFNPAIVNKDWLVFQEIVPKDLALETKVITPGVSILEGGQFVFLVDLERLQFTSKDNNKYQMLADIARRFFEKLPHTPCRSVGLNFEIQVEVEGGKNSVTFLKNLFPPQSQEVKNFIENSTSSQGVILVKEEEGSKLRLVIEPADNTLLRFSFNFHFDAPKAEKLIQVIAQFEKCRNRAVEIVNIIKGD